MIKKQLLYICEDSFGTKVGISFDPIQRIRSFIGKQVSNAHYMIFEVTSSDYDAPGLESVIKQTLKDNKVDSTQLSTHCQENGFNYIPHTETYELSLISLFIKITELCPSLKLIVRNCPDLTVA